MWKNTRIPGRTHSSSRSPCIALAPKRRQISTDLAWGWRKVEVLRLTLCGMMGMSSKCLSSLPLVFCTPQGLSAEVFSATVSFLLVRRAMPVQSLWRSGRSCERERLSNEYAPSRVLEMIVTVWERDECRLRDSGVHLPMAVFSKVELDSLTVWAVASKIVVVVMGRLALI